MSAAASSSSADAAYAPVARAVEAMRQSLREAPERFAAASKDVGVLQKLLRNPADQPEEPRFRKLKLTNATVARVLATTGVREVLEACGFSADAEHLELRMEATDTAAVARLSSAAEAVEAAQRMLQELHWIATVRNEVPSLAARPWAADGAAHALVQACLAAVSAPASDPLALAAKIPWVRRLNRLMFSAELQECRSSLSPLASVAIVALQTTSLELIRVGARDVRSLVEVSQCLAQLWPPGEARTLDARLDFAFACMEAALPPAGEPLELRLRLVRRELLGSAIEALGAFSEMGVRCGVLKQPLTIEYVGEAGQDAGGLRRQFFDLFTAELPASRLWTHTDAGGLRPVDRAALTAEAAAQLRPHMEACGRVCGMALYQELHRRLGVRWEPEVFAGQPPSLLGDSFARYFLRAVRHDPPATLAELQAELRAECPDSAPDYRAGPEILTRSLRESGLEGQTFVRHVGGAEVPLVEGGAVRAVCDESKAEWLERMLRAELVDGVAAAAAHFRKGLVDAISPGHIDAADALTCRWTTPHFFLLTADELQAQWSGAAVSRSFVASCRATATVHPEVAQQAQWLWEVLDELDDAERARWFRFLTGSSRGPRGGANLRIGPRAGGDGAFPFAHACVSSLDLPSYSSRELLRERLGAAVKAAHDKFTDL